MAAKGKASTSKTAHVMNLLSKNRTSEPAESTLEPAAETPSIPSPPTVAPISPTGEEPSPSPEASAPSDTVGVPDVPAPALSDPPHTSEEGSPSVGTPRREVAPEQKGSAIPPIIASLAPDAAVASQIKSALEAALEAELEETRAEKPEPAPIPTPPSSTGNEESLLPERVIPSSAEPEEAPLPLEEEIFSALEEELPSSPSEELSPVSEGTSLLEDLAIPTSKARSEDTELVNIMEVLVEEKMDRYMKMIGVCPCQRCADDVKALALSQLPSRYVVLRKSERSARFGLYEGRYNSEVIAQLTRACTAVKEHPRHDSPA